MKLDSKSGTIGDARPSQFFESILLFVLISCLLCGCATVKETYIPSRLEGEDKAELALVYGHPFTSYSFLTTLFDGSWRDHDFKTRLRMIDGKGAVITHDFVRGSLVKVYLEPGEHAFTFDHYTWGPKEPEIIFVQPPTLDSYGPHYGVPDIRYRRKLIRVQRTGSLELKKGEKYTWSQISAILLKRLDK